MSTKDRQLVTDKASLEQMTSQETLTLLAGSFAENSVPTPESRKRKRGKNSKTIKNKNNDHKPVFMIVKNEITYFRKQQLKVRP